MDIKTKRYKSTKMSKVSGLNKNDSLLNKDETLFLQSLDKIEQNSMLSSKSIAHKILFHKTNVKKWATLSLNKSRQVDNNNLNLSTSSTILNGTNTLPHTSNVSSTKKSPHLDTMKTPSKYKRLHINSKTPMKKIKVDIVTEKQLDNLHDELLEDSFSCFDDTQDLINRNSRELAHKGGSSFPLEKHEEDSFSCFDDTQDLINRNSKELAHKGGSSFPLEKLDECIPDSNNSQNKERLDSPVVPLTCDVSKFNWLEDTQTFIKIVNTEPQVRNHEKNTIKPLGNTESIDLNDFSLSFSEKHCGTNQEIQNTNKHKIINNEIKSNPDDHSGFESQFRSGSKPKASEFSQYIDSTQFLAELDEEILKQKCTNFASSKSKQEENCENADIARKFETKEQCNENDSQNQIRNDGDIVEICPSNEQIWANTMSGGMTEIFKNPDYRKEVDRIFQNVETTICEFGCDRDKLSNASLMEMEPNFNDNNILQMFANTVKTQCNSENISALENSTIINAILNITDGQTDISIGDVIKKTLLKNATKQIETNILLNHTLDDSQSEFKILGNFYDLPNKVKDLMKLYKGIDTLYDWQEECLNLPAVKARKNLVYALPTSGGKTLVAEILILREILCRNRNVLLVLPYVAIVQEKVWALSPFAVALDFLIEEYAAGKGNYPPRKRRRKNSVYIATIEKALGLVNSLIENNRLNELGLVVVDELHLLGDGSRGPTLEALLTKLIYLKENVQVVGMSATIGNIQEVCQFLEAEIYTKNFRPVELVEYVKCGNKIAKVNWSANNAEDLLIPNRTLDFGYKESLSKIDPDMLGGLVREIIPNDSCLVFCSTRKNCENVAYLLCKVMSVKLREHKHEEKEALKGVLSEETGVLCSILDITIPFGVAYHHSGLTSEERKLIEDAFRAGIISVICCTSTLAAGVNLPAKRVILRSPYIGRDFINLSRYKQMVGRAGRAGLGESGESILVCSVQELPKVKELLTSPMDLSLSGLLESDYKGVTHLILSCIHLNLSTTRRKLQDILSKTLLAVQQDRFNVKLKKIIDEVLVQLFKVGALQIPEICNNDTNSLGNNVTVHMDTSYASEISPSVVTSSTSENVSKPKVKITINNDTNLKISKLGSAAIKAGLDLTRAQTLYDDLYQAQASLVLLDCLHLLYLVTPYDVSEKITPAKTVYYSIYTELTAKELQTAKIIGLTESCAIRMATNQSIKSLPQRILNRFYVTLMLYDLWNESTVYQVSEKFQVNRGLIQNLMTTAATFASNVVHFCEEFEEFWPFTHLLKGMSQRLSHCCVRELVPLMELPAVKQNRAKQLYNAGYKTLQSIAKTDPNELIQNIEYMTRKLANQLIAASKMLLLEKVENLREEAQDVLDGIE